MRRAMLLSVGVGAGGVVLLAFCIRVMAAIAPTPTAAQVNWPVAVEGTILEVQTPACYEGLFWEDGTGKHVTDIAALVVKNTGGCYVEQGEVIMDWGDKQYTFAVSWLPPGETALLLEKDAKHFAMPEGATFSGWTSSCLPERLGLVSVSPGGETGVCLHNKTNASLPEVTLYYKRYDWESEMYIGGSTETYTVEQLPPGEYPPISLPGYLEGYSRVVCVLDSGGT